jgi:hypothetical protein
MAVPSGTDMNPIEGKGLLRKSLELAALAMVTLAVMSGALLEWGPHLAGDDYAPAASSVSVQSIRGLQLHLSVNGTSIPEGEEVLISVWMYNPSSQDLQVSAAGQWQYEGFGTGPCGPSNLPMGILVFSGNLSIGDLQSAEPLELYEGPPVAYHCPVEYAIAGFVFHPLGDNATYLEVCGPSLSCQGSEASMTAVMVFSGYYVGGSFKSFDPGVYTVVGGDEWGGIVLLHFVVL